RPDTLMQLSRSLILEVHLVPHGRAIHFGTKRPFAAPRSFGRSWRHSGHEWACRLGGVGRVGLQCALWISSKDFCRGLTAPNGGIRSASSIGTIVRSSAVVVGQRSERGVP